MKIRIEIEKDAIVVCLGATGTGKSTFLSKKFPAHYILSSDEIRERMWGDFRNQTYNKATFEILFATLEARAKAKVLTVVDTTGTQSVLDHARQYALQYKLPLHLFVFPELKSEDLTQERMKHRWTNMGVYEAQLKRIAKAQVAKEYQVHLIPYSSEDREDVKIDFISEFDDENETHRTKELNPQFRYMVVPDLHGEVWAIRQALDWLLTDTQNRRLIQLGDINDRGASTYETFAEVYKLWKDGYLHGVLGNHDAKFARWLQKYLKSEYTSRPLAINYSFDEGSQLAVPKFDMNPSHGLLGTLEEFCAMDAVTRNLYAQQFLEYTQKIPYALKLTRAAQVYYFSHAGLSDSAITGTYVDKHDMSICIYDSVYDASRAKELFEDHYGEQLKNGDIMNVWLVNGHTFGHLSQRQDIEVRETSDGYGLIACDVGIGKRSFSVAPRFLII